MDWLNNWQMRISDGDKKPFLFSILRMFFPGDGILFAALFRRLVQDIRPAQPVSRRPRRKGIQAEFGREKEGGKQNHFPRGLGGAEKKYVAGVRILRLRDTEAASTEKKGSNRKRSSKEPKLHFTRARKDNVKCRIDFKIVL